MYNPHFVFSNTVFYTDIFDQNKASAELADLKIDVEGVLWKYLKSHSSGGLKDCRSMVSQAPKLN